MDSKRERVDIIAHPCSDKIKEALDSSLPVVLTGLVLEYAAFFLQREMLNWCLQCGYWGTDCDLGDTPSRYEGTKGDKVATLLQQPSADGCVLDRKGLCVLITETAIASPEIKRVQLHFTLVSEKSTLTITSILSSNDSFNTEIWPTMMDIYRGINAQFEEGDSHSINTTRVEIEKVQSSRYDTLDLKIRVNGIIVRYQVYTQDE